MSEPTTPTTSLPRIAILVDVQNIYYTTREQFGANFDYNKFWAEATKDNEIYQANAYAINKGDEKQRQFQNILRAIGFNVRLKPFIQRSDGSAKGDWDVGLTIDALEAAPHIDKLILLSGDGDFSLLVEHLQQRYHIEVEVYGVPNLTAGSLVNACDHFREIDDTLLLHR
ncbi:NYN domain-containing protein [Thaumasiovibrio sp. DFM-14]|uniref:NYN domain-containing protein n=1 Tax=Thaumasiovibrio sp. DFM-14 TaxID=3384792 RepID=UPI0039A00127